VTDAYDRTVLLLRYSEPLVEPLATALEETKERQNKVSVGANSAGIVSGALGVAAAATILTPVGAPLLIASLVLGGGATATQAGTEAKNAYFSEPHKLANRILALSGVANSLLRIVSTLRDAMLRCHIRTDVYENDNPKKVKSASEQEEMKKKRDGVLAGVTVGRLGLAGMEVGTVGTVAGMELGTLAATSEAGVLNAQFLSRTGTNLMKTARVARFAGGALSAATIVLEARCMSTTIKDIRNGNPCEKAQRLREVKAELEKLPTTSQLDTEIERYLEAASHRDRALTQDEVVQILLEQMEDEGTMEKDSQPLVAGDLQLTVSSSSGEEEADENHMPTSAEAASAISREEGAPSSTPRVPLSPQRVSLLERIETYKQTSDSPGNVRIINGNNVGQHQQSSYPASSVSAPSYTTTDASAPTGLNHPDKPSLLERIALHKQRKQRQEMEASLTL
jgi:hypothetical protein